MKPAIIFEDEHVLVIDKPSGLLMHPDGRTTKATLVDWVRDLYPHLEEVGESMTLSNGEVIKRPGIVHRLDADTSGILVLAKDQDTFLHLKQQFKNRVVKKIYHAFVYGMFKEKEGVIDRPIGKSKKDFRQWSAQRGAGGTLRDAVTEYTVLEQGNDLAYLEVRPQTGRTHQIRVHMKAIHHPVVCDRLYAPKHDCKLHFTRLALHACAITFTLLSGESLTLEAPLPQDFERALKEFKKA